MKRAYELSPSTDMFEGTSAEFRLIPANDNDPREPPPAASARLPRRREFMSVRAASLLRLVV
jgi:hypothetical protein